MDRYQSLRITGTGHSIDTITECLRSRSGAGWARSETREKSINAAPDLYCFECEPRSGRPGATVWVSTKDDGTVLYDTTIVPTDTDELSIDECNVVLRSFVAEMLEPCVADLGVHVDTSGDTLDLRDHMSKQVEESLRQFSSAANRATGSLHPMDRERWFRFIIAAHNERADWQSGDLEGWLRGEGWSEEKVSELASEYEFGRELLLAASK